MGLFRRLPKPALRRGRSTGARRRLLVEPLEDRRLLAELVLGVQLWTNEGNAKGELIDPVPSSSPTTYRVSQGTTFFLQVLADDERDPGEASAGVIALPLDLAWNLDPDDPTVPTGSPIIRYADSPPPIFPDDIDLADRIVTSQFVRQRFVDGFARDERANNLRGGTIPSEDGTQPIGRTDQLVCTLGTKDDCREFSLLRFAALNAGTTLFRANLDGSMSFADGAQLDNNPLAEVLIEVADQGTVSGRKFYDLDGDGQAQESNEPGLADWQIYVDYDDDGMLDSGEPRGCSGSTGSYTIAGVNAGTWKVREVVQQNWTNSYPPTSDSRGRYWQVPVPSGGSATGIDFGNSIRVTKRLFLASTPPLVPLACPVSALNVAFVAAQAEPERADGYGEDQASASLAEGPLVYGPLYVSPDPASPSSVTVVDTGVGDNRGSAIGASETVDAETELTTLDEGKSPGSAHESAGLALIPLVGTRPKLEATDRPLDAKAVIRQLGRLKRI